MRCPNLSRTPRACEERITREWALGLGLAIAASREDVLADYITGYVVGTRAYLGDTFPDPSLLHWQAGTGLLPHLMKEARAMDATVMFPGLWTPDMTSLAKSKRIGGRIVRLPAISRFRPRVASLVRRRRSLGALRPTDSVMCKRQSQRYEEGQLSPTPVV